jgi:hypothetical protein
MSFLWVVGNSNCLAVSNLKNVHQSIKNNPRQTECFKVMPNDS